MWDFIATENAKKHLILIWRAGCWFTKDKVQCQLQNLVPSAHWANLTCSVRLWLICLSTMSTHLYPIILEPNGYHWISNWKDIIILISQFLRGSHFYNSLCEGPLSDSIYELWSSNLRLFAIILIFCFPGKSFFLSTLQSSDQGNFSSHNLSRCSHSDNSTGFPWPSELKLSNSKPFGFAILLRPTLPFHECFEECK